MEPHRIEGIEPHWTEDEGKRRKVTRFAGWTFLALGVLQLFTGDWLYGAFLLGCAAFALTTDALERLPKVTRYLLLAAFVAFCAFLFVKMVADLSAMK
jgi:uncharacterized membrane protein YjjP (DUF1212 family)